MIREATDTFCKTHASLRTDELQQSKIKPEDATMIEDAPCSKQSVAHRKSLVVPGPYKNLRTYSDCKYSQNLKQSAIITLTLDKHQA